MQQSPQEWRQSSWFRAVAERARFDGVIQLWQWSGSHHICPGHPGSDREEAHGTDDSDSKHRAAWTLDTPRAEDSGEVQGFSSLKSQIIFLLPTMEK